MSQARFSVVTPNFNMANMLPETIESVLQNLREGDEYVVVDAGSSGDDVSVIKRYEKHLNHWISEPDNGYADGIRKGFEYCTAEYMCWINSGDLLLDGALDKAREILSECDADMIYGDDLYIDENNLVLRHSSGYVEAFREMMLYGLWTPLQDACFWRRSIYDKVQGLNPKLNYAADYAFFLNIALTGKIVYTPFIFSCFRKHSDQKSSRAKEYKEEKLCIREMALLNYPTSNCVKSFYRAKAWWRARVASRFHRQRVQLGTSVKDLSVMEV
jgi:glycosyltransferase involved in cell wall biosynthesis